MRRLQLLYAIAVTSFAQSSEGPLVSRSVPSERRIDRELEVALGNFDQQFFDGVERYFYNRVDLDGDGKPEVLVYITGRDLCGSGGCQLFVLQSDKGQHKIIAEISLARAPVIVSSRRTRGWRDLILYVSGGGILRGYHAVLKFDGKTYPENPTVPPAEPLTGKVTGTAYMSDAGKPDAGVVRRRR